MTELTSANFESTISSSGKPVLVDFWAPWCGPCKVMEPILEQASQETDTVAFAKVNVDEHPDLAQKYNILSIPTFVLFKNAQVLDQFSGTMGKETLLSRMRAALERV